MTELDAAICNMRMWERFGINWKVAIWARKVQLLSGMIDPDRSEACRIAAEKSNRGRMAIAAANRQKVYEGLTGQMTTSEVAQAIGMERRSVTAYMTDLEAEGRVVRTGPAHRIVWERVE